MSGTDRGPQPLATKLLLKPGDRVFPINPPKDYRQLVGTLPGDVKVVTRRALPAEVVHIFATSEDELQPLLREAIGALQTGGRLWIAYPRVAVGVGDVSRKTVHDALHAVGWRPVTQIAMDETWTAIRGRPATAT